MDTYTLDILKLALLFSLLLVALFVFSIFILIFRKILTHMVEKEHSYIDKNANTYEVGDFAAVLIVKKYPDDDITLFSQGISYLLKHFKYINKPYIVFLWPTIEEFKQIVKRESANELYIFGHGKKNQLDFEDGKYLKYEDLKNIPEKRFIGQYHCNHGSGKSLADYLDPKEKDRSDFYRVNILTYFKFYFKYVSSKY